MTVGPPYPEIVKLWQAYRSNQLSARLRSPENYHLLPSVMISTCNNFTNQQGLLAAAAPVLLLPGRSVSLRPKCILPVVRCVSLSLSSSPPARYGPSTSSCRSTSLSPRCPRTHAYQPWRPQAPPCTTPRPPFFCATSCVDTDGDSAPTSSLFSLLHSMRICADPIPETLETTDGISFLRALGPGTLKICPPLEISWLCPRPGYLIPSNFYSKLTRSLEIDKKVGL